MDFLLTAPGVLFFLTLLSILFKDKPETLKYLLFGGIMAVILLYTGYLVWSTITKNVKSATGGPVHWHADFEIFSCGQPIEIIDPEGFSNKIGTETVHEHNDKRIHIEGALLDLKHASLGYFFNVIGGSLDNTYLTVPTNDDLITLEEGQICPDGSKAHMQVFLYKTEGKTFSQRKLEKPQKYVISPHSQVPPGDCVIIEFGKVKERTDKLCNFYEVAVSKGELYER